MRYDRETPTEKRCTRCKVVKLADQFREDKRTMDRLSYRCLDCLSAPTVRSQRPMP
jgi:hypothetical protein